MKAAAPFVRAVVVVRGESDYLLETLAAVSSQSRPPDAIHLAVVGKDEPDLPPGVAPTIHRVRASTFGAAVDAVLDEADESEGEWLWLLHDDSTPAHTALDKLLDRAGARRLAGVVGAAQTRWTDARRLVNIGTTVSRVGARRIGAADGDDLDQGQHDAKEDVLAVGLAGAIVTRGVWRRLGGTDPAYGVFGDSQDFCRRAWRAGYDVVIAPEAKVRHAQTSLRGRAAEGEDSRATHAARRAAEWYHAMAWSPGWRAPLLLAWCILASLVRAAVRLAASDLRLAVAELRVPWVLAGHMPRLASSRAAIARVSRGAESVETPLLAGPLDVARSIRTRELGAYEAWRAERRPSDVQRAELGAIAVRRRWTFVGLVAALAAISVLLFGTWYAPLARGGMLVGTAMGASNVSLAELWARASSGWSVAGFGSGAGEGAFAALLMPLAAVPGGLAMGLGGLMLLSPLIGGVGAWFAAGAATRSLPLRATVALAWATMPVAVQAASDGRVGALIAHLLLPWFALAFARSLGRQRREKLADGVLVPATAHGSPVASAGAALALAAIGVAAPVLLPPLVAVVVGSALLTRGSRRFALTVPLPAILVQAPPFAVALAGGAEWWRVLLREEGPALASTPASGWQILWGVAQAPPAWGGAPGALTAVLTYGLGLAIVAAALAALASGRASGAVALGWLVAAACVVGAIALHRTIVVAPSADGSPPVNGWPGPLMSLAALALLMAACAAAPSAWAPGAVWNSSPARLIGAALAVAVVAVHAVGTVWPGREFGGDVHPASSEVLPLVAALDQRTQPLSRVLVLWEDADGVTRYGVESRDGATWLLGRGAPRASVDELAPAVAILSGGGTGAADALVAWGIDAVVVAPDATGLASSILRSPELALTGSSDLGWTWTVRTEGDVPASIAWIETDLGARVTLDNAPLGFVDDVPAAASGAVVLATPADPRWSATLDGRALPVVEAGGRQAWRLERGGGRLEVAYVDSTYRTWWWVGVIGLAWAAASAIPLHDRRFRRTR